MDLKKTIADIYDRIIDTNIDLAKMVKTGSNMNHDIWVNKTRIDALEKALKRQKRFNRAMGATYYALAVCVVLLACSDYIRKDEIDKLKSEVEELKNVKGD